MLSNNSFGITKLSPTCPVEDVFIFSDKLSIILTEQDIIKSE